MHLTREKYELRRQAEAQQAQLQEMQQYLAQRQPQPQQPMMDMPKLADFDYDEGQYQQAVQNWHQNSLQQIQHQQNAYLQQQQVAAQQAREQQTIAAKIAEGQSKYPDFAAKVNDPSLPSLRSVNPAAFEAVMDSPATADVAYYLASNPLEVYGFQDLTPNQAIRKVASLEAQLMKKPSAAPSVPPKPVTKVRGRNDAGKDPSKMSTEEFIRWRNANVEKHKR